MSRKADELRALDIVAGRSSAAVAKTPAAGKPKGGISGLTLLGAALWVAVILAGGGLAAYVMLGAGK